MKRKIQRYLGNGNDDNIRYLEDGRFDFNGDVDGVLHAVREYEGRRSTSGKKCTKIHGHVTSKAFNRNSASRILFDDKFGKTPHLPVHKPEDSEYYTENILHLPIQMWQL